MPRSVQVGSVVSYNYSLRNQAGRLIEDCVGWPFQYVHTKRPKVIAGVVKALLGHHAGDTLHFAVPPEEAYGAYDPEAVLTVPRKPGTKTTLAIGDDVAFNDGQRDVTARVRKITPRAIELDLNDSLAGQTLHFDIDIVSIREATPREMRTGQVFDPFDGAERRSTEALDPRRFPFDLFNDPALYKKMGRAIESVLPYSMFPPYPWGQRLYGRLFEQRCKGLEGDVIELGVGRGGMSLYLAQLAQKAGKRVFSYDSYEGLPEADSSKDNPGFRAGDYRGSSEKEDLLARFEAAAKKLKVSKTITPVKGFFEHTVPKMAKTQRFCFAHLDSDLYDSVFFSLEQIYDRVADGAVIVIDDYFHHAQGPARAVSDFFNARQIHPVLHVSFPYSVFFVKGLTAPSRWHRCLDGHAYSFEWLRNDALLLAEVKKSVTRAKGNRRVERNGKALLELLEGTGYRNSDIYRYLAALEDYWDSFASQGQRIPDEI